MSFDDIPESLRKTIRKMTPHEVIEFMDKVYGKVEGLETILSMQKNILEFAKIEAARIFQEADEPLQSIKTADGRTFSVRVDTYFSGMKSDEVVAFCRKPTIRLTADDKEALLGMIKDTVHPQTFQAWLRERNKEGQKLPQQINVTNVARVVRRKG